MTKDHHSKPLSVKQINSLKKCATPYRVPDYPHVGLNLSVLVSGSKKWVFAFTHPITKKRQYWSFGDYPSIELSEARRRANDYRQQVTDGLDPRQQHKKTISEQQKKNALLTVDDLFLRLYVPDLEIDKKTSAGAVRALYIRHIKPHIGHLKAADVDLDVATHMLSSIGEKSVHVERKARSFCLTAWRLGLSLRGNTRWKKSGMEFAITVNPFLEIAPPKGADTVDERCLSKEELIHVWQGLNTEYLDEQLVLAMRFLFATGQRLTETLHAKWDDFDLIEKTWTIPWATRKTRNKIKTDHIIPLTDFHLNILKQIKIFSKESEYIFPDKTGEKPRSRSILGKGVTRFCKDAGMVHFAPKVSRKVFKTLGGQHVKIPKDLRDKLQGHSVEDISSKHYDKYNYLDEKREAMEKWTDWLAVLLKVHEQPVT